MIPFGFWGWSSNMFPYTNFHDMNLDWIIWQVKHNKDSIEQFRGELEQMGVDIEEFRQYIENIDSEIQQKVEEEVPAYVQESLDNGLLTQVVDATRTRRIVIIGDSYGQGYTPEGMITGYPELIRQRMGLVNGNTFFNVNKGGARFGAPSGDEYAFDTVLAGYLSAITNKHTITDIIIAGGYNDATYANADITAGIERTKTIIKNNFTNPSLKVWLFGLGYSAVNPRRREQLFDIYHNSYANSGFAFTSLTKAIYSNDWWASDGFHPTTTAQTEIANAIINIINGGNCIKYAIMREFNHPTNTPAGSNIYINTCNDYFNCFFYLNSEFTFETPTTLNTQYTKIAEFNSNFPLTTTDNVAEIQKFPLTVILHTPNVDGRPAYQSVNAVIYMKEESRGVYGIYLSAFNLNSSGTNYDSYTGITGIIIPKGTPFMYIPMRF